VLNSLKTNYHNYIEIFYEYFEIYGKILSTGIYESESLNSWNDELLISFLSKKIIYSLLHPFLNKEKTESDEMQFERDLVEFFEILSKYLMKTINNVYNFIFFTLSNPVNKEDNLTPDPNNPISNERNLQPAIERSNLIIKFLIKNLIKNVNSYLKANTKLIYTLTSKNNLLMKILKILADFNKILKKEYNYDIFNNILISDIFSTIPSENLQEFFKTQKSFTNNFIKLQVKEKLYHTVEKAEYNTLEIFDSIRMIIKDNYNFLLCFKSDKNLFELTSEMNYFYSMKELISMFRGCYNEEIQIFSSRKNISRKKILSIQDLIIKFLLFTNKLYQNLSDNLNIKLLDIINKNMSGILTEVNKMIENYTSIFTKELRANGFDDLINLFTYDNLIKLDEERIFKVISDVKGLIQGLVSDLENVKISIESENYFLNALLHSIIARIIEECDRSLKKSPKNKNFTILTEKTLDIIENLTSRYTFSQNTLNSLNKPMNELKNCFSSLNMNKI
jgi:hypothetical protein